MTISPLQGCQFLPSLATERQSSQPSKSLKTLSVSHRLLKSDFLHLFKRWQWCFWTTVEDYYLAHKSRQHCRRNCNLHYICIFPYILSIYVLSQCEFSGTLTLKKVQPVVYSDFFKSLNKTLIPSPFWMEFLLISHIFY